MACRPAVGSRGQEKRCAFSQSVSQASRQAGGRQGAGRQPRSVPQGPSQQPWAWRFTRALAISRRRLQAPAASAAPSMRPAVLCHLAHAVLCCGNGGMGHTSACTASGLHSTFFAKHWVFAAALDALHRAHSHLPCRIQPLPRHVPEPSPSAGRGSSPRSCPSGSGMQPVSRLGAASSASSAARGSSTSWGSGSWRRRRWCELLQGQGAVLTAGECKVLACVRSLLGGRAAGSWLVPAALPRPSKVGDRATLAALTTHLAFLPRAAAA